MFVFVCKFTKKGIYAKTNANYPLQYCHFSRFTLSLNKISGTSAIKMKVSGLSFCIALGLHYLCKRYDYQMLP